ncbi:hypothetical protein E3N88_23693 [Mikania micrantha]|uniref:Uncharacterized protein n=1 Tax=Mikania micrantha TaxID=192012 RepID=A0A5N6NE20_9ASTR|nr:hypothetical protein E3N88_23693 [Mikania micrantha]
MGLQEVGAYLKLDKTEAMLQPLTMHGEDLSSDLSFEPQHLLHNQTPDKWQDCGFKSTKPKVLPFPVRNLVPPNVSNSSSGFGASGPTHHDIWTGKGVHYVIAVADE